MEKDTQKKPTPLLQKKTTMSHSPITLMRKMKSVLPVAGPNAEKTNIIRPPGSTKGLFLRMMAATPKASSGRIVPKERMLSMIMVRMSGA